MAYLLLKLAYNINQSVNQNIILEDQLPNNRYFITKSISHLMHVFNNEINKYCWCSAFLNSWLFKKFAYYLRKIQLEFQRFWYNVFIHCSWKKYGNSLWRHGSFSSRTGGNIWYNMTKMFEIPTIWFSEMTYLFIMKTNRKNSQMYLSNIVSSTCFWKNVHPVYSKS